MRKLYWARHQVDGLYLRSLRRLSWFISSSYSKSEIARRPLTIALAPTLLGEVDHERPERLDAHVLRSRDAPLDEPHALLDAEQRVALAQRAVDDRDHDLVVERRGARDHVEVPVGDGVVGAGADRDR